MIVVYLLALVGAVVVVGVATFLLTAFIFDHIFRGEGLGVLWLAGVVTIVVMAVTAVGGLALILDKTL